MNGRGRESRLDQRRSELARSPLFGGLTDAELLEIARHASGQALDAGGSLVLEPGTRMPLVLIVGGSVRLALTAASGREFVLSIAGPGEVLGEPSGPRAEEAGIPPPTVVAIAQEPTRLLYIPWQSLRRARAPLAHRWNELLAARTREMLELIEDLALHTLEARLARVLARLHSRSAHRPVVRLHRLNQGTLALMANATRPKVNQHLQRFQQLGVIELNAGLVRVRDRAALMRIARHA